MDRPSYNQNDINAMKGGGNEITKLLLQSLRALECCFHPILTKINVYFHDRMCREVANGFGIKDNILIRKGAGATDTFFFFFLLQLILKPEHCCSPIIG